MISGHGLQIEFSGYTFAPLLPDYDPLRCSQETLVTHVIKMDFGGWIAVGHPLAGVARGLLTATSAWRSWLLPMVRKSILLKLRVRTIV